MKTWEAQQKHEQEQKKIFQDLGFLSPLGTVWKFDGKAFWPRFESMGHTSCDFHQCKCKEGTTRE
jgi:hypothetical protein